MGRSQNMNSRREALVALLVCIHGSVLGGGGVLYGTVRQSTGKGGPLAGVTVVVACPSFAAEGRSGFPVVTASAVSDQRGSFTLFLRGSVRGKCEMRVKQ